MKNKNVVIEFEHNGVTYSARVLKHNPTAVVLPDKTILKTCTVVLHQKSNVRRNSGEETHTRQIFNKVGELVPLQVLSQPGNSDRPKHVRFPLTFAEIV